MFKDNFINAIPAYKGCVFFCTILCISNNAVAQNQEVLEVAEISQRLQRLERVMDNRVLLDMLQRIESVLGEVRQLRGEIERIDYEMKLMGKRQRDLYMDVDRRIQALKAGSYVNEGLSDLSLEEQLSSLEAEQISSAELPAINAEEDNATFSPDIKNNGPPTIRKTEKAGERERYTKAYDILMAGDNETAVGAFEKFLNEYPLGPYSDNAQYWQGEANYVSRRFTEAVDSFKAVVKKFPDSVKVPDAKLKIAFALFEQEKFDESRTELEALIENYPETSAARLATKRLKSMSAEGH